MIFQELFKTEFEHKHAIYTNCCKRYRPYRNGSPRIKHKQGVPGRSKSFAKRILSPRGFENLGIA